MKNEKDNFRFLFEEAHKSRGYENRLKYIKQLSELGLTNEDVIQLVKNQFKKHGNFDRIVLGVRVLCEQNQFKAAEILEEWANNNDK